jgi:PKD repeat protein
VLTVLSSAFPILDFLSQGARCARLAGPSKEVNVRNPKICFLVLVGILPLAGCSLRPQPLAVAAADPREGYAPLEVVFDGTSSSSPSPPAITSYRWDFGDGATATGPVAVHTYEEKGAYRVTLAVVDGDGHGALDELIVRALNRTPHAEFHYTPYGAPRDHPVAFDASGSYDPDGSIVEYVWDFGDGTAARGVRVEHVFPRRLEYRVTLTVIDDDGTENRSVRTVIVAGCDTCG